MRSLDLGGVPIHKLVGPLVKSEFLKFVESYHCFGTFSFLFLQTIYSSFISEIVISSSCYDISYNFYSIILLTNLFF